MHYSISYKNPLTHLVDIEISTDVVSGSAIDFQLPAWRPGRYELQNYAANIKSFKAYDENGDVLSFAKTARNMWRVNTAQAKKITIRYQYYAYQMDAGGCWLDEEQLYLNFICCMLYNPATIDESCIVALSMPDNYQIACGLQKQENVLHADNFYQLADSPMIASDNLTHFSFTCDSISFHIWIKGENHVPEEKFINDFKKYTDAQLSMMGSFPEKEYHYLFQFLPYRHYHGVEHRNSTVITLGPAESIAQNGYPDLIGISSHELFHAWNIIKIRPTEMFPYNFTKENYFTTGFVAEGFTTYYGDLFLVRSGVISVEEYFAELNTTFKRHFDHFGNLNLSLAESSFDLWVDGYSAGIPDRKVSIYVKGCVAALILDLEIRQKTNHKQSLDDLLRLLWNEFGKKNKGYSFDDIISSAEKIAGASMQEFFDECILGHTDLKDRLQKSLSFVNCELSITPSENSSERFYGFKTVVKNSRVFVEAIAPASPAELVLSKDDEILKINGVAVSEKISDQIDSKNPTSLVVKRWGRMIETVVTPSTGPEYYPTYQITQKQGDDSSLKQWLFNTL